LDGTPKCHVVTVQLKEMKMYGTEVVGQTWEITYTYLVYKIY